MQARGRRKQRAIWRATAGYDSSPFPEATPVAPISDCGVPLVKFRRSAQSLAVRTANPHSALAMQRWIKSIRSRGNPVGHARKQSGPAGPSICQRLAPLKPPWCPRGRGRPDHNSGEYCWRTSSAAASRKSGDMGRNSVNEGGPRPQPQAGQEKRQEPGRELPFARLAATAADRFRPPASRRRISKPRQAPAQTVPA